MNIKKDKLLTALFDELKAEYRKLSPSERESWVLKTKEEFSANIASMQQHVSEVEYGEHVEGLVNPHFRVHPLSYNPAVAVA